MFAAVKIKHNEHSVISRYTKTGHMGGVRVLNSAHSVYRVVLQFKQISTNSFNFEVFVKLDVSK